MKIADAAPSVNPVQSDLPSGLNRNNPLPDQSRDNHSPLRSTSVDTIPSENRIEFNKIAGANDQAQEVAQQIRAVDKTMKLVEENVQNMRDTLDTVLKVYPPYPKGSNERIQALRKFAGLRKMIDQLTYPPPDDSPGKILGDSKTSSEAGNWELTFGKSQRLTIHHQPLHTGSDGLNIPELSAEATDDDMRHAAGKLKAAQQTLTNKHNSFVADANQALKSML